MTLSPFKDVRMCGHVTWVGKSSMEVTMTLKQVSVKKSSSSYFIVKVYPFPPIFNPASCGSH